MKGAHINTRMSIFRRVTLFVPLTIFLLSLAGFAMAKGVDTSTEIYRAPVAGAEIGRATAFSDPAIVQILSFLTPGRRIFRPGPDRGQN